ncbi:MAG: hypothetical protein IIC73_02695, partial [Armatimonadetes bacterium]|nr:hypothetical protein [Armatimonadota bacterium]
MAAQVPLHVFDRLVLARRLGPRERRLHLLLPQGVGRERKSLDRLTFCIELQELDSFNKAETTKLKAFFSSRVDNYRPPYGRRNMDFPRQCVFSGTTNQAEYFKDSTGNLRFLPVFVRKLIGPRLIEDRDQLWAEAVYRYKNGEQWWPGDDEFKLMVKQQSIRGVVDPWQDIIYIFLVSLPPDHNLDDHEPVTTRRILTDVLDIPAKAENQEWKS